MLNRANARRKIFEREADYLAFERILAEMQQRVGMRVLAWCVMPNHWHLVLWPRADGHLSQYMRLLTLTHTQRWHAHRSTAGTGHLYQGRFKSFVVQHDTHFLTVCRYVEGNALRASLVQRAEQWRWSSLWTGRGGGPDDTPRVDAWPLPRPQNWAAYVNDAGAPAELDGIRHCTRRGTPYGDEPWAERVAKQLELHCTLRARGRPRKQLVAEKGS